MLGTRPLASAPLASSGVVVAPPAELVDPDPIELAGRFIRIVPLEGCWAVITTVAGNAAAMVAMCGALRADALSAGMKASTLVGVLDTRSTMKGGAAVSEIDGRRDGGSVSGAVDLRTDMSGASAASQIDGELQPDTDIGVPFRRRA